GLSLCVFCYLVIETPFVQGTFLRPIALTGSACIPVVFWMLSRSIFDDHFTFTPSMSLWFLLQTALHFPHYLKGSVQMTKLFTSSLDIMEQLVSLGFVLAAIYVALKTRRIDLIESRLRFRNTFITITALLIGITLIVEITPIAKESEDFLQVMQRSAILGLTGYFLISNFAFQPGFFFLEIPKSKVVVPSDPVLEKQLMSLLHEKKIYRNEGLTIKELADIMQVQEHRLRRLINGQLGFKNFNDFLNQYRVNEACGILSDPSQNQKTILEIAYSLGYQSIGPFNKAFRDLRNTTPTAFRKFGQS
ncbi:AraC family transcriptional regulator, partial [bacterium]|nr:AraC family transcriptional regulator [bacterium]